MNIWGPRNFADTLEPYIKASIESTSKFIPPELLSMECLLAVGDTGWLPGCYSGLERNNVQDVHGTTLCIFRIALSRFKAQLIHLPYMLS